MDSADNVTPVVVAGLMAVGAAIMSPALEVLFEKHKDRRRLLGLIALVGAGMIALAVPLAIRGVPSGARLATVLRYWPVMFGGFVVGNAYYLILRIVRRWWLSDEQARLGQSIDAGVAAIRGDFDARLGALATKADVASQGEERDRNVSHLISQVAELHRNLAAAEGRLDHLRQEVDEQDKYAAGLERDLANVPMVIKKAIAGLRSEFNSGFNDQVVQLDADSRGRIEPTPPIQLTAVQIHDEIQSVEMSLRREHSKRYLGAYIKWNCWLNARQERDETVRLGLQVQPNLTAENFLTHNARHAMITISASARKTPALMLLKEYQNILLRGRIWRIGANGFSFWIDDASIETQP